MAHLVFTPVVTAVKTAVVPVDVPLAMLLICSHEFAPLSKNVPLFVMHFPVVLAM